MGPVYPFLFNEACSTFALTRDKSGAEQFITGNLGALTVRPELKVEGYRAQGMHF